MHSKWEMPPTSLSVKLHVKDSYENFKKSVKEQVVVHRGKCDNINCSFVTRCGHWMFKESVTGVDSQKKTNKTWD